MTLSMRTVHVALRKPPVYVMPTPECGLRGRERRFTDIASIVAPSTLSVNVLFV